MKKSYFNKWNYRGILELEQNEYKRIKTGNINEEETNQLSKNGISLPIFLN